MGWKLAISARDWRCEVSLSTLIRLGLWPVVPLELMLVETDAPFLAPVPYRGRPNAPYLIPLTLRALAEVKAVDEDAVAAATAANAEQVFGPWR